MGKPAPMQVIWSAKAGYMRANTACTLLVHYTRHDTVRQNEAGTKDRSIAERPGDKKEGPPGLKKWPQAGPGRYAPEREIVPADR
jgi:hypothetical protein